MPPGWLPAPLFRMLSIHPNVVLTKLIPPILAIPVGSPGLVPPILGGVNVALADGSVRPISFAIDLQTFRLLCVRNDGQPVTLPE